MASHQSSNSCTRCLEEPGYLVNPRCLPCGHIYCEVCFEAVSKTTERGLEIQCSYCGWVIRPGLRRAQGICSSRVELGGSAVNSGFSLLDSSGHFIYSYWYFVHCIHIRSRSIINIYKAYRKHWTGNVCGGVDYLDPALNLLQNRTDHLLRSGANILLVQPQ